MAPSLLAVLPALAALAVARVRARRRRAALNRALHELRRPLQALALGSAAMPGGGRAGPDSLRMAIAALEDLDREVNGIAGARALVPLRCRDVVEAAAGRWRGAAARGALGIRFRAGRAEVLADPARLGQALDNLIANALEHGGPGVLLDASVAGDRARLAVVDGGGSVRRRTLDPRRGHGLRVVADVAAEHGGRLVTRRTEAGNGALLELPLARAPADLRIIRAPGEPAD